MTSDFITAWGVNTISPAPDPPHTRVMNRVLPVPIVMISAAFTGIVGAVLFSLTLAPPTAELARSVTADPALVQTVEDQIEAEVFELIPVIVPDSLVDGALDRAFASEQFDTAVNDVAEARIDAVLGRSSGDVEIDLSDYADLPGVGGLVSSFLDVRVILPPPDSTKPVAGRAVLALVGALALWGFVAAISRDWIPGSLVGLGVGVLLSFGLPRLGSSPTFGILGALLSHQSLLLVLGGVLSILCGGAIWVAQEGSTSP